MTYNSKEWTEEIRLPDGSTASSVRDVERFLRRNNLAMASDYSDEFRKNVRLKQQQTRLGETRAEFIRNYKRLIWK